MCMGGGGGGSYTAPVAPKVDPVPTAVTDSGQNSTQRVSKEQRRKKGQSSNVLSADRDTILGSAEGTAGTSRTTLG
jgi:hypothetical protein|nr:MAG TPA: hypothetical protein [Caudoviricetes sp.]